MIYFSLFHSIFKPVVRYTLNGTLPWREMTIRLTAQGNSGKDVSNYAQTPGQNVPTTCPNTGKIETFQIANLTAGSFDFICQIITK